MQEEGKIMGYDKKTLMIVASLIVVALVMFYAGAKYEKNKLSKLGLLKNSSSQSADTVGSSKKAKKANTTTETVVPQKFADQEYAKVSYLISGPTISADAQKAIVGFQLTKKALPDGMTEITLKSQKPEYHDQVYVLKAGEQLYFIEKFLQDDENGEEKNIMDDTAVVVGADGMVIAPPRDFSK
jgi:hypothetical protein